jgi:hypothetical protein
MKSYLAVLKWIWFECVPQRFMYCKVGHQCDVEVVESSWSGAGGKSMRYHAEEMQNRSTSC